MTVENMHYKLILKKIRPYFAEIPYYLWGTVNYDSVGDCRYPTDTDWTWLKVTNRDTGATVEISGHGDVWKISGEDTIAARTAMFFSERVSADTVEPDPSNWIGVWKHSEGMDRAKRVELEFASPKLKIFDSHLFWGSWKWIGWFATEFTWVGRWIMLSVLKGDSRGIPFCIDWLRDGTFNADQSSALRQALYELTGESLNTDDEWVKWYEGGLFGKGAKLKYPRPHLDEWLSELKSEYGDTP